MTDNLVVRHNGGKRFIVLMRGYSYDKGLYAAYSDTSEKCNAFVKFCKDNSIFDRAELNKRSKDLKIGANLHINF